MVRIAMGLSRLLLRRREVDKVACSWLWLEDSRRGLINSWLLQLETAGSLLEFTARRIDDATRQRLCCRLENHYLIPGLALCSSGATFVVAGAAEVVTKVDGQGEDGKT